MTGWAIFYLVCFLVGITLTVLAFLGGGWHLPHVNVHTPTVHTPHVHVPLPHGGHLATPHAAAGTGQGTEMPMINFGTLAAFLIWFGGSGYLLTRYSTLVVSLIMLIAVLVGMLGAAIIFWFVAKVAVFMYLYIWYRATFPRYRFDQLMKVGWKVLLPIAIGVLILTAIAGVIF